MTRRSGRNARAALLPFTTLAFVAGCHGSGGTPASTGTASSSANSPTDPPGDPPDPASYSIGGTISGLPQGVGILLADDGIGNPTVWQNGPFTLGAIAGGSTYNVTEQGFSELGQSIDCTFNNASGVVATANVTNVAIACQSNAELSVTTSGLSGAGLVLTDGLGDSFPINETSPSAFQTAIASGVSYTISVTSQPLDPGQTCDVLSPTGTAAATIDVTVSCSSVADEWTWIGGAQTADSPGVYGPLGAPSTSAIPGAREGAVSWTDAAGNLWLFGGNGYDSGGNSGDLNDLWQYARNTNQWTWVSGSDTFEASGSYGSEGVASGSGVPGARDSAVSWIDAKGNLWLFGGFGNDSTGDGGDLNDLWEFSPVTGEWTWVSGSQMVSASGAYGTLGQPSTANAPGAREQAVSWKDAAGNLWLFGGFGYDANGYGGYLNDLWEFSTATGQWVWESGSENNGAIGSYGTQGVAAGSNAPGAREGAISWTDAAGNLWLFGGFGYDANGYAGELNDLWEFSPTSEQWTWVSGSQFNGAIGSYGTQGVAAGSNAPGAREGAVSWTDAAGNLWLFGGAGYDANGYGGYLNDLWELSASTGQWAWMSGSDAISGTATYGTLGTASAANVPGARQGAISWVDPLGNFWLFGGYIVSGEIPSDFNDLWNFAPPSTTPSGE